MCGEKAWAVVAGSAVSASAPSTVKNKSPSSRTGRLVTENVEAVRCCGGMQQIAEVYSSQWCLLMATTAVNDDGCKKRG